MDEAGRGPWAGPVVAAAVVLRVRRVPARIDDSKRLTPAQRLRAYRLIVDHGDVGIGIVCAEEIDRHNILRASLLAMQHAVQDLPAPPDLILVDGPIAPPTALPCWPLVHGDQRSYLIGCASITAKVLRDRLMAFYHGVLPHYRFDRHKGYGTALHAVRLRQFGPSTLHRLSFKPVMEAVAALQVPASHEPLATELVPA